MAFEVGMKRISARDAKNGFGRLIDTALAEPVLVEKHGRGVVIVLSVEEYKRLTESKSAKGEKGKGKTSV